MIIFTEDITKLLKEFSSTWLHNLKNFLKGELSLSDLIDFQSSLLYAI